MPKAHRRVALIVGAALATAAVAAIPALATNVVKIDSKVRISHHARHGPDHVLGHDETNHNGGWKVHVDPISSGAYYARVTRREEGAAGTIFVCRRDRSKTVVVD